MEGKKTRRFWHLLPVPVPPGTSVAEAWPAEHSLGFLQGVRFIAGQAHWILLRLLGSE